MAYKISYYSIFFLVTMFISMVAAVFAWRRRHAPGGSTLFLMMAAVWIWTSAGFMEASALQLSDKIIWSKVMYLGAHTSPPLFLIFASQYTHHQKWVTKRNVVLLFIIPALTILLAATNELHHLIWTGFSPVPGIENVYIYEHGLWFWVATIFINCVLFAGTFLLFQFALRSKELYRYQTVAVIIADSIPWVAFAAYIFNFNPFPGLDTTAISFTFTGTILVFTILRLRFLDVIPVARELLVENMVDGLLVLDGQNRIVDINPAARQILGIEAGQWIGQSVLALSPDHPALVQFITGSDAIQTGFSSNMPEARHTDARVSYLPDRNGKTSGRMIVLQDVTDRKISEGNLQRANLQLQEKLAQIEILEGKLREQATRDELTGLFNRRHLIETLDQQLLQAEQDGGEFCVVIIDFDHFKEYNDANGHLAGDDLLRELSELLTKHIRSTDIAFRYGGDEIVLVMYGASPENAYHRVDTLRQIVEDLKLGQTQNRAGITFSAGIAVYPVNGKTVNDLLRAADKALYAAKATGRNCTRLS